MLAGKSRRGHSLIELTVAVAVFIYLMMSVAWGLVYCNRYLRNVETRAEAQTQSLSALIWLSRSITEANVTTMSSMNSPGVYCVDFSSPRDPGDGSVSWDPVSAGILWRQQIYCYLTAPAANSDQISSLVMKGFPMSEGGGTTSVGLPGSGPPYPAGCPDLPNALSIPSIAIGMSSSAVVQRTVAPNIRQLLVDIYNPNQPGDGTDPNWANLLAAHPEAMNTCNITLEGFAPYYGLNYGVIVNTQVRITN